MTKKAALEPRPLRTIYVKPYQGEMIKAGEIIEIVGHHSLGLSARRTANLLIHNAHSPDLGVLGKEFEIDVAEPSRISAMLGGTDSAIAAEAASSAARSCGS